MFWRDLGNCNHLISNQNLDLSRASIGEGQLGAKATSGHLVECPLSGVKRTFIGRSEAALSPPAKNIGCNFIRLFRLDVGRTDYLSPLIDFFGDEFPEFGGRVRKY
jgi:hypothetical protein